MIEALAEELLRFTERQGGESPYLTAIDTMAILRSDQPKPPMHRLVQPALCIVAQGAKWASFGAEHLEYRAGQALVIGLETPSLGRVFEARPEAPCLVLTLGLDTDLLRAVAEGFDPPLTPTGEIRRGSFVIDVQGPIADCAVRLVRLLATPKAIKALYPVIMREISYWLLAGPDGAAIAGLASANAPSYPILSTIQILQERFRETIRVDALASMARMSPSAFHRQFKALTAMSPLQYQKQLRLLEARRLLLSRGVRVEAAAFEVGYVSPSQFSREYARMFGAPPKRDVSQNRVAQDNPAALTKRLAA